MVPNLFQQISTGLCPSVATYFRGLTQGAIVFPSGSSFQRNFGDYEVKIDAGPERRLSASVSRGEDSLTFRSSRHAPGATVFEREDGFRTLASAVQRSEKSFRVHTLMASVSMPEHPALHVFALTLPKSESVLFQFSDDAGLREPDFVTFAQADVERVTVESNLWRGHVLVCPLDRDPELAPLLGAAGLRGATHLDFHGYFVDSLRAASRGLRLVFRRGQEILCELPRRDAFGL